MVPDPAGHCCDSLFQRYSSPVNQHEDITCLHDNVSIGADGGNAILWAKLAEKQRESAFANGVGVNSNILGYFSWGAARCFCADFNKTRDGPRQNERILLIFCASCYFERQDREK